MEKFFISAMLLFSFVVISSSCKKKKDDPAPSNPPTVGVSFSWNGTAVPLNAPTVNTTTGYNQVATHATNAQVLTVHYPNGKPTVSTSYNVDTQGGLGYVSYVDQNGDSWSSYGGTLTVTVNQGFIISTFTNLVFHNYTTSVADITINSGSVTTN